MTVTADPIRAAIYQRLAGDATLTGLLSAATAIFHQRAPQAAVFPLVIFHKQDGRPRRTFAKAHWDTALWVIKAVDKASSASTAETIAARVDALLDNHALVVTGRQTLSLLRDSDIDYPEPDGAETLRHVGAMYRLNID
jgi:hypothetical protein